MVHRADGTSKSTHFMFALALWQIIIAALAIVVAVNFDLRNGGRSCAFPVSHRHQIYTLTGGKVQAIEGINRCKSYNDFSTGRLKSSVA